jgi:hypothetical protein
LTACWLALAALGQTGDASGRAQTSRPFPQTTSGAIEAVYYDGSELRFAISQSRDFNPQRSAKLGPWDYGERTRDQRPRDGRANLYLASPGQQHRSDRWEYDHNAVVNTLSRGDSATEWDVYWAIVLDPALRYDFRNERDLLLAAQSDFTPGDLFEFSDVPGRGFLRDFLHINSLARLNRFRRKNGRMPRLIIVPAGFTIRGIAARTSNIPNPPALKKGTTQQ